MSGIRQQIFDQVSNVPSFEEPALFAAPIIAGACLVINQFRQYGKTAEALSVQFPNHALLEDVVEQAGLPESPKGRRWQRLGSTTLTLVGAGIFAGSLMSGPHIEATSVHSDDQVVFVVDSSTSMLTTHDMKDRQTRTAATIEGLKRTNYNGSAAVMEFGANNDLTIPMSSDWKTQLDKLGKSKVVDPNGGDIETALKDATPLFNAPQANDRTKSEHTLVVISDGTLETDSSSLATRETKLNKRHISVKTVVPGTPAGTYQKLGEAVTSSGIAPELFVRAGEKNVQTVTTPEQLTQAVDKVAKPGKITTNSEHWYVPMAIGAGLAAWGIRKDYRQRANRII